MCSPPRTGGAGASPPAKRLKLGPSEPQGYSSPEATKSALPVAGDGAFVNSSDTPASPASPSATTVERPSIHGQPDKARQGAGDRGRDAKRAKWRVKRVKALKKAHEESLKKMGEEPIWFEIVSLLGKEKVDEMVREGKDWDERMEVGWEGEVEVVGLTAHGDGLAVGPTGDWILAIPFCLPGERVRCKVIASERLHARAEFLGLVRPAGEGNVRDDNLVKCKYFGQCSGCQYQMIPYEEQLRIKQSVVTKAFANYSGLDASLLPAVLPTIPSPKQYGYRTKLTPHFQLPRLENKKNASPEEMARAVEIGFDRRATKRVMDIEECAIGTETLNEAMPVERERVRKTIGSYKRGATLLLRDSLASHDEPAEHQEGERLELEVPSVCITDHKATVKERVGGVKFESPAGAFFQNNRSILGPLTDYVGAQVRASPDSLPQYLVDAYCGSGLFSLTLASRFEEVAGVEISADSVRFATRNAELNGISNARFIAGKAEDIFASITYPPDRTTVIIDPPRRGSDEAFLSQLLRLRPKSIVYVSCNVHTCARDVGYLVRRSEEAYTIESIVGMDLFPQTAHVEGVTVLRRR